ncbi:NAD(P)/FAD-dependent oxidoreductase [Nocardioides bigeumensis]|uniref:NAD(P)/FAD-dependent oxidoreductase n=1 Tax=Nocardioides bigeumensis TaxID=433657 RepID=A0ABN2YBC0_9ACTN
MVGSVETTGGPGGRRFDLVIVGAGFAGLYMLYRARQQGLDAVVIERGSEVGGTWYWNRYPGARCDIESVDYCYSFSPELVQEWDWTERYAAQPEILAYLQHVADRFDLRDDIVFERTLVRADWGEAERSWTLRLDDGSHLSCTHVVMATGNLSAVKPPSFDGLDDFAGEWFHTGMWPHHAVDWTDKTVAVIGTGSSGIQVITQVAPLARHLTVLQRTPNYSMPAHNRPLLAGELAEVRATFGERRRVCQLSDAGTPLPPPTRSAHEVTEDERRARYEEGWQRGGISALSGGYTDFFTEEQSNLWAQEFARDKIREIVTDPDVADRLSPRHHIGTKRTATDTGYFEMYNRANVDLVDVRDDPISHIEASGIRLESGRLVEVDVIVFAIGFDAMTGALADIDIRGTDGLTLETAWADGPRTYLGLQTAGFPNLFMITGPQSPGVLSNMVISIEQHVDFVADCLAYLREHDLDRIEASEEAQDGWVVHTRELAEGTLYLQARSWYLGANIPGKPRVFMPYVGGCGRYRTECETVVDNSYRGFVLGTPTDAEDHSDG